MTYLYVAKNTITPCSKNLIILEFPHLDILTILHYFFSGYVLQVLNNNASIRVKLIISIYGGNMDLDLVKEDAQEHTVTLPLPPSAAAWSLHSNYIVLEAWN